MAHCSVDDSAGGADLAAGAGENADGPHLDNGGRERSLEAFEVAGQLYHVRRRAPRGQQGVVGGKEAAVAEHEAVVMIVELVRRLRIHRNRVVARRRALLPQRRGVLRVQPGVRRVQPLREGVAVRNSHRVSSREDDHLALAQALGDEQVGELGEFEVRRREDVGVGGNGDPSVSSPGRHPVVNPSVLSKNPN